MTYILAIDQGTTSSRAIIFDQEAHIVASAQQGLRQIYPHPGWVEHDPMDIWSSVVKIARRAISSSGLHPNEIKCVGITNQRETTLVWDRTTGTPVYNAIVWQDRRTSQICERLRNAGVAQMVKNRTGLVLDPYFSGTKLAWLLENLPGVRKRALKGELAFGTIDSWLLWMFTNGKVHATDSSNASRTLLFNIHTLDWDPELLELLDIPRSILPQVRPSVGPFGHTDISHFGVAIPITGVAGDQHAATFGQACFHPGMVKNTYGTGSFLMMNTGTVAISSKHQLLTTVGWTHTIDQTVRPTATYALEGSVFVTGAAIQWLRDELGIITNAAESGTLAQSVPDAAGVHMVPAFTGLGAPYWRSDVRGAMTGLTRGTTKAHIVRATLEAAAFQSREVLEAMQMDCGVSIPDIRVDGGMAANDFLMKFQADILGIPVHRPHITETTALGAAWMAAIGQGIVADTDVLEGLHIVEKTFNPTMSADQRENLFEDWKHAVKRLL